MRAREAVLADEVVIRWATSRRPFTRLALISAATNLDKALGA